VGSVSEASEPKRLDQFLKYHNLCATGGEAKVRIQDGEVRLNGEIETRRKKQLSSGDVVELAGETLTVR